MKLIACIDNNNGLLFGGKRQSRDRIVTSDINATIGENQLYFEDYSSYFFKEDEKHHLVENLGNVGQEDFFFLERPLNGNEQIDQLITYCWNRDYLADTYLDVDFNQFKKEYEIDFPGFSHKKITKSVYRRKK